MRAELGGFTTVILFLLAGAMFLLALWRDLRPAPRDSTPAILHEPLPSRFSGPCSGALYTP